MSATGKACLGFCKVFAYWRKKRNISLILIYYFSEFLFLLLFLLCVYRKMKNVVASLAADRVCDVHKTILGIREGKEGWFQFYCPGNVCCDDDGELWGKMVI